MTIMTDAIDETLNHPHWLCGQCSKPNAIAWTACDGCGWKLPNPPSIADLMTGKPK